MAIPGKSAPHEIVLIIDEEGKISSEVKGIDGPSCSELTKWLEELGTVEVDSPTADYKKLPRAGVQIAR